jgi:SpoVK/Ycf46/Vps4 family AAA+-type ATPase
MVSSAGQFVEGANHSVSSTSVMLSEKFADPVSVARSFDEVFDKASFLLTQMKESQSFSKSKISGVDPSVSSSVFLNLLNCDLPTYYPFVSSLFPDVCGYEKVKLDIFHHLFLPFFLSLSSFATSASLAVLPGMLSSFDSSLPSLVSHPPSGLFLHGTHACGKTLFARSICSVFSSLDTVLEDFKREFLNKRKFMREKTSEDSAMNETTTATTIASTLPSFFSFFPSCKIIHIPASSLLHASFGAAEQTIREIFGMAREFVSRKTEEVNIGDADESESGSKNEKNQEIVRCRICVIVLDDVDISLGKRPGFGNGGGEAGGDAGAGDTHARLITQLLQEMDGVTTSTSIPSSSSTSISFVFVIACATDINRVDVALLRPGRLECHIRLGLPTAHDREWIVRSILAIGKKNKPKKKAFADNRDDDNDDESVNHVDEKEENSNDKEEKKENNVEENEFVGEIKTFKRIKAKGKGKKKIIYKNFSQKFDDELITNIIQMSSGLSCAMVKTIMRDIYLMNGYLEIGNILT